MSNEEKFSILRIRNGLTQADCANLISEITQRPLSVRTVRSWLNDQTKRSSRPCPDWAVQALENAIAKKKQG